MTTYPEPRLYINGEWRETADTAPVTNPANDAEIGRLPIAGPAELDEALAAAAAGCTAVELWTDTRFTLAHRVYQALGYRPSGRTRELHDLSQTTEYHYAKRLTEGSADAQG